VRSVRSYKCGTRTVSSDDTFATIRRASSPVVRPGPDPDPDPVEHTMTPERTDGRERVESTGGGPDGDGDAAGGGTDAGRQSRSEPDSGSRSSDGGPDRRSIEAGGRGAGRLGTVRCGTVRCGAVTPSSAAESSSPITRTIGAPALHVRTVSPRRQTESVAIPDTVPPPARASRAHLERGVSTESPFRRRADHPATRRKLVGLAGPTPDQCVGNVDCSNRLDELSGDRADALDPDDTGASGSATSSSYSCGSEPSRSTDRADRR
jgi:hypothetical protein